MGIVAAYAVPHPPLIIPACGQGEERGIQATIDAYEEVAWRIAAHKPDTIVLSSPHAPAYRDAFVVSAGVRYKDDFSRFRAPFETVSASIDNELVDQLAECAASNDIPLVKQPWAPYQDHGTFIPLWFVQKLYSDFQVLLCGLSGLPNEVHFAFGQSITQAIEQLQRRVVYIASGDLSHKLKSDGPYGYAEEGPLLDKQITDAFAANDLAALFGIDDYCAEAGAECGLRSFMIMAGALDGYEHSGDLLSYEGPFGVGYGVAAFEGLTQH